jgi:exosortase/archaeosortase family protein
MGISASTKETREFLRFAASYLLLVGFLFTAAAWTPDEWFYPINRFTAQSLGLALNLLDQKVQVQGVYVTLDKFGARIIGECTAVFALFLYVSFIAVFPAPRKNKIYGFFLGIPAFFVFNMIRLIVVLKVASVHPGLFKIVHVYFGQVMMILFVFTACFVWLGTIEKQTIMPGMVGFIIRSLIYAGPSFIIWLYIHKGYVFLIDRLVIFFFALLGSPITLSLKESIYSNHFNVIAVISFVMAAAEVPIRKRLAYAAGGVCFLSLIHFFYRIIQVYHSATGTEPLLKALVMLRLLNFFLLPFLILFLMLYQHRVRTSKKPA